MFQDSQILKLFKNLPKDKQTEVIDFMEWLNTKKEKVPVITKEPKFHFGCMKGLLLHMSDDFDEPLEDFAEYMP